MCPTIPSLLLAAPRVLKQLFSLSCQLANNKLREITTESFSRNTGRITNFNISGNRLEEAPAIIR